MIPKEFSDFFSSCDLSMQQQIIDELIMITAPQQGLLENADLSVLQCPNCESKEIRGNGKLKGMQRYVCKECRKNFSQSTGKFWFALKKRDLISQYMYYLISGYSIRKCAALTGISIQTSFDWRHKLLTSFNSASTEGFRGIIEQNELYFQYSEKGKRKLEKPLISEIQESSINGNKVAVIATCDRSGTEDLRVITKGDILSEDILSTLEGRVRRAGVIISNSAKSNHELIATLQLELRHSETNKRQRKAEEIYHMQNVNNMNSRLLNFLSSFRGVATKYLQNYLNWFLMLDKIRHSTQKIATLARVAMSGNRAWYDFQNKNINIYFRT